MVASRWKKSEDTKDGAQGRVLLIRRERDELNESVFSLRDVMKELMVAKAMTNAAVVVEGVEQDSLEYSLPARDA